MPKIVKQSVTLPASARKLYDMYLSPAGHRRITGMKATVGKRPGRAVPRVRRHALPERPSTPCRDA